MTILSTIGKLPGQLLGYRSFRDYKRKPRQRTAKPIARSPCSRRLCRPSKRTGERWFAAELNRHKGQLLLRQGHSDAAKELYREALSIARTQEAKLWELRAASSLAQLWRDQGRRAEARDLLAPVYGWFTEGFETPDLKETKALLEELGSAG